MKRLHVSVVVLRIVDPIARDSGLDRSLHHLSFLILLDRRAAECDN